MTACPGTGRAAVSCAPYVSQRPYVFSQIRFSREPAGQPPYPRPSAHTSCRPPRARGRAGRTPDGARRGGVSPGTRWDGVRRGGGAARSGDRGADGGPARRASGAVPEGGAGRAGLPGDGLGSTTASSASRPGGCTICGITSCAGPPLSARGGRAGPGCGSTDTHPETAATATPMRRVVVNLVRCTRATLGCGPPLGQPEGEEWPARVTRSARRHALGPASAPAPGGGVRPGHRTAVCGHGRRECAALRGTRRAAGSVPDRGTRPPAGNGQTPVAPSTRSRTRSAWPLCRAYSSIMCV
ncbi:hypothetical protein YUWDRAFT_03660 [Streptomyces sp. AmelKG-D3]|nr:hypothetical protein YUWDRAFT_03660 [Streptomyces sp. AmelKG-D3]